MIQHYIPNHFQLLPDLQMISDELEEYYREYVFVCPGDAPGFRTFQIYSGQDSLQTDVLYVLRDKAAGFPVDSHSYIALGRINGRAPHICSLGGSESELVNRLLSIFQRYMDFISELNRIVSGGGDLDDLPGPQIPDVLIA